MGRDTPRCRSLEPLSVTAALSSDALQKGLSGGGLACTGRCQWLYHVMPAAPEVANMNRAPAFPSISSRFSKGDGCAHRLENAVWLGTKRAWGSNKEERILSPEQHGRLPGGGDAQAEMRI